MLNIKSINKTFNKNSLDEYVALNKLNLHVSEGEFITVIGGNGAGKSTLFNAISGSVICDSGEILLDNMNITNMPEHRRATFIGRVFQDPLKGTAPNLTVGENLTVAYMRSTKKNIMAIPSKKDKNILKEHLASLNLGLENRMNTKIGMLSGGQRQAVTLIMATLVKPKLLLLDEHTAALDPSSAQSVIELTEKIVYGNNITTLMITHNMSTALNMGSRTIMMEYGNVIKDLRGEERRKTTARDLFGTTGTYI